jgi:SAM-dependent methyltransferase
VLGHFQAKASSFDRLYDARLNRYLRPAIFRRLRLAIDEVSVRAAPTVLDIGCGPGRVAELALDAGASAYVGVDFSAAMLELAGRRLKRFGSRARLCHADVLEADIGGRFDIVLALGVFDYTPEPDRVAARMYELCAGTAIASFPRWNWLKGPIRSSGTRC